MTNCEFCVIKYISDIARFEPINIGIALLDKKKKQLHNKFITNFNDLFLRLGTKHIHGLEKSFEGYNPKISVESEDHLWKLYDGFHGNVFYSKPTKIISKEIDVTLDRVFNKMISIKVINSNASDHVSVLKLQKTIRDYFSQFNLSSANYCEGFNIEDTIEIPQTRQFAFLKEGQLHHTIDTFNFLDNKIHIFLLLFMHDMNAIANSEFHNKNKPYIFSTTNVDLKNFPDRFAKYINLLAKKNITIINPENHQEKLEEIKECVV